MAARNPHLSPRTAPLAVGDAAPDFTLTDQGKKEWKLSDAVGKGDVVLCFFPLAFTGTCGDEMKCVNNDFEKWSKRGAQVVGISCDSFATLRAWAEKEGFKQTLLADMHREVVKGYGVYWADLNIGSRATVVIGRSADGKGRVKFVETREPGKAMKWEDVLAMV
jgi:peroxiredoxin (alkyl hydroperoxide reductase subunit C)